MWIYEKLNKRTIDLLNYFNMWQKHIIKNDLITFAIFNNFIKYMFTRNGHLIKINFEFSNKQWNMDINGYSDIYETSPECILRKTFVVEKLSTLIEKINEIVDNL